MANFNYYSLPGFGEQCRKQYGFSDACIIGDRMIVTGQTGMNPLSLETSPNFDQEVTQAFQNVNDLILQTLKDARSSVSIEQNRGWDYVVKIRAFIVNLSNTREQAREQMVRNIKKWCPNHQPLFTMVGVETLPFPEHNVEIEVDIWLN
ncbi:uncharacterized protein N7446_008795 [Penicillium canescens]|uniref:Uncharacterized protein n=1 Tax=Penicillium canescens TaxID=5083 RepID=A0AAD6NEB7_PENCN|nr:uncharacterized protein N7446_008795 [Penicillium canescens]KAJ6032912.1 hypothetical protein N7444_010683 [Penicillium canescens]KAJ6057898.1 hypothetical protein N7460_001172 [Penicillium canescens]KAJ6059212.1 hypothetical protein N7446_008795 [Penicillium canescens]